METTEATVQTIEKVLEDLLRQTDEYRRERYEELEERPGAVQDLVACMAYVYSVTVDVDSSHTAYYVQCACADFTHEESPFYLDEIDLCCDSQTDYDNLANRIANWLQDKMNADEDKLFAPVVLFCLKDVLCSKTIVLKGKDYQAHIEWLHQFARQAKDNELELDYTFYDIIPFVLNSMWYLPEEFSFTSIRETIDSMTDNAINGEDPEEAHWIYDPCYRFLQAICNNMGGNLTPEQQAVFNYAGEYGLRISEPDNKDRNYHSRRLLLVTSDMGNAEAKEILEKYKGRKYPKNI